MITIDELKIKIDKNSRLLGIDIGTKRIGLSICDERRSIATPYKTLNFINIRKFIDELKNIIDENNIKALIIGFPVNMDGTKGKSTQSINDKSKIIAKEIGVPVAFWDERLSTVGAFNISRQLDVNISKRMKNIDEKAAAFILQGAIDYLNN